MITLEVFLRAHCVPWARSKLEGADKYIERMSRVFPDVREMAMTITYAA